MFHVLRAKVHHLHFYPGGIEGFVESCVLASQREMSVELRDITLMNDLRLALNVQVAEDVSQDRPTIRANDLMKQALPLAEIINDHVHRKMELLGEDLGPYSVDPSGFKWTGSKGLVVRLTF